ncbi:hypothetical protein B0T36_15320 [Nocardia donostiensis]|uniref:HAD family hydrolase n=1 Tax=Nocardia donostiensis TaxID=1538463 RepID=UPI0009F14F20|nr:HAD-IA family hydrolase [Nocardia donostiensis]OQS14357.1 hypothetical protein B0T36_15320 [Nocardia donostiensis]
MTALQDLLATRPALLLDFDGPVCSVFAGLPSRQVAKQLSQAIGIPLPPELGATSDPFEILEYAATFSPSVAEATEQQLTRLEIEAVSEAMPTPFAHSIIRRASTRQEVAIVSNNSTAAIEAYLRAYDLRTAVSGIYARTSASTPLKPAPYLLNQALAELGYRPDEATFIGDSITDIQAAHAAGLPAIAFANKPGKAEQFAPHKPATIFELMFELSEALPTETRTTLYRQG